MGKPITTELSWRADTPTALQAQLGLEGLPAGQAALLDQSCYRLGRLAEAWLPGEMVLDLGGLEFMDSSGIAVVVQTARKCAACGSRFALCRVPAQAKKVLCAAGIDRLVRIWEEERP